MIILVLPEETGDQSLLQLANRGDKEAIGEIYRRHVESIYQFARMRVASPQIAEDITNTVFEKFLDALARRKGPRKSLRGWLFQVARHTIYDLYKEEPPLPIEMIEQISVDHIEPELQVIQTLDSEKIRTLIQQLSPNQQEVLLLRFDQQLSLRETADVMGKNINTIKTLQLRAVQNLRRLVQREMNDD